jgi:GT2 family glycosyltransferase
MAPALRAQTVLYGHSRGDFRRLAAALLAAARLAYERGVIGAFSLAAGDCSPRPLEDFNPFDDPEVLEGIGDSLRPGFGYLHFGGENLGHAGGHDRLFEALYDGSDDDLLLIVNPDTYPAPSLLVDLLPGLDDPATGIVEARQLPLEHPKAYDPATGETSWASGACFAMWAELFRKLGGFDAASFFLHCDDVDLSWRLRLEGYRVVHRPSARIFHDKRLTAGATVAAGPTEAYHSALAQLIMAHKYSRPDRVEALLCAFEAGGTGAGAGAGAGDDQASAAAAFRQRRSRGDLPEPIDADHRVGEFTSAGDGFGPWRFTYD